MADQVIIIDDEPKTKVVEKQTVVVEQPVIKTEKKETVTERTVVRETRDE